MSTQVFGSLHPLAATQSISLWWYSLPVPESAQLAATMDELASGPAAVALGKAGVYVFEGCHDTRPNGGVLYIGQVGSKEEGASRGAGKAEVRSRTIRQRAAESFRRFAWVSKAGERQDPDPEIGLYADVWNLKMRWAEVASDCVEDVEALLIRAHAPSFNAQNVRSPLTAGRVMDLLVMNAGVKGMLLPVVAGKYFDRVFWNQFE